MAVDQSSQFTDTDHVAGLICDLVIRDGLRFSQSSDGRFTVGVSLGLTQWDPDVATIALPEEISPHNPRYVSTQTDGSGAECQYVGYGNIEDYGKTEGIDLPALRHSLCYILRSCPEEYVVRGKQDGRDNQKIGVKLTALPMLTRLIQRVSLPTLYGNYAGRAEKQKVKDLFLEFSKAVLAVPETQ